MSKDLPSEKVFNRARRAAEACLESAHLTRIVVFNECRLLKSGGSIDECVKQIDGMKEHLQRLLVDWAEIEANILDMDFEKRRIIEPITVAVGPRSVRKLGSITGTTAHEVAVGLADLYGRAIHEELEKYLHWKPTANQAPRKRACQRLVTRFEAEPDWSKDEWLSEIRLEFAAVRRMFFGKGEEHVSFVVKG